jgi:enamine deaminase RidA (YjgF/YER057c/UK114 family)
MTVRNLAGIQSRTGLTHDQALAKVLATAGQSRLVSADEVAARVLALCAEDAAGVNGQAIVVDGGGPDATEVVNPGALGEPVGWSNGVLGARGARPLFIAGQTGVPGGGAARPAGSEGASSGFTDQFARALDKVLAVVRAAGGGPASVARLTVFVTDLGEYRASRKALGDVWRSRFGKYYPAMALVEVKGLVDEGARVEIEGTAVIGGGE